MKKKGIIISVCALVLLLVIVLISIIFKKEIDYKEEYLKILNNRSFIYEGKSKTLKDILTEEDNVESYSFVDYGNDSKIEMYVRVVGRSVDSYVFNLQGKKMYGYLLDENVVSNTSDGYSSFSGKTSGWVKYTFSGKKMKKEKIANIDYENNKCEFKGKDIDCNSIVEKEIEFLDSIGEIVDSITYTE